MRIALVVSGWVVVAVTAVLLGLRLTHEDLHSSVLLGLVAASPVLLLVVWPVLLGALARRVWWLAAAAAVLVAVHVLVLLPLVVGGRGAGGPGTSVRVLALNVKFDVDDGAAVSRQVRQEDPDIVVLSELSDLTMTHLDLSQYLYSTVHAGGGGAGSGIWSRWPLSGAGTRPGVFLMSTATVTLPGGGTVLVNQVHLTSPTNYTDRFTWQSDLRTLTGEVQAPGPPTITAGDFNATREHAGFTPLLGGPRGVADAADGRGLLPTWPSSKAVPPVMRLDHVLVTREIGVRSVRVLGPTGSDHRAVLADLVVHP